MNNQNDKTDIIEKYLEDELNTSEKKKFEEELLNDPELKEEIMQHQLMIDGIRLHGRKALLSKTKQWDAELEDVAIDDPVQISTFRWYYVAAAFSLIAVSIAVIYSRLDNGFERIVAAHYEPYNYIPDTQRSTAGEFDVNDQIFQYYDQGKYAKVIELIQGMDNTDRTDIYNFLQANAYQAIGENKKAIPVFTELANSSSMYSQGSKWYLALCYLSENQPDMAMPLIEELKNSNSSFTPKAERLLKDLM